MFAEQDSLIVFLNVLTVSAFFNLHVRWQTIPRSRSCNMKSTFTEMETTVEYE